MSSTQSMRMSSTRPDSSALLSIRGYVFFPTMPVSLPIPLRLVPGLLRARGLEVGLKRISTALRNGVIPGKRKEGRWVLTEEEVDAAERYFRELAERGRLKGGATGLGQTKGKR